MTAMLETKNLGISFGGLKAVDGLSLKIEKGQLYGLIGPNGAGKTTAFNLLTGVYKPTMGNFFLDGEKLTGHNTIEINKKGELLVEFETGVENLFSGEISIRGEDSYI